MTLYQTYERDEYYFIKNIKAYVCLFKILEECNCYFIKIINKINIYDIKYCYYFIKNLRKFNIYFKTKRIIKYIFSIY